MRIVKMLQLKLRTQSLVSNLLFLGLIFSLLGFSTCQTGPKVTVYISNPARGGMDFSNNLTGEKGFVPYSKTDKYVALTPTDAETLLNWCEVSRTQSTATAKPNHEVRPSPEGDQVASQ